MITKKTYKFPKAVVINLEAEALIANSPGADIGGPGGTTGPGGNNNPDDDEEEATRRFNIWNT